MLRWWTKHAASRSLLVESPVVLMALKYEDGKEKKKKGRTRVGHDLKKTRERFDFLKEKRVPLFCYCPVAKATRMRFIRNIFFYFILDPNARALSRCPLCPSVQFPFKLARRDTICFVFFS